jgi:hypothetical protein
MANPWAKQQEADCNRIGMPDKATEARQQSAINGQQSTINNHLSAVFLEKCSVSGLCWVY